MRDYEDAGSTRPATRYGSADAAERATTPAAAAKAYADAERRMAAQRAAQDAQLRSADALERAAAQARAQQQARSRAQAALRAVAPRSVVYSKGNRVEFFDDAADFLARKYGLNRNMFMDPQAGPEYAKRYGLKAIGGGIMMSPDGKKPVIDPATGRPVRAPVTGYTSEGSYGADGVFMGWYDTNLRDKKTGMEEVDPDASRGGRPKQYFKTKEQLIVPADAAKGVIYGWSPQKVAQFQASMGIRPTGVADSRTTKKWSEGVLGAQKYYQYAGVPITPGDYLDMKYGDKGKGGGSGGGGGGRRRGRGGGGGGGGGGGASSTIKRTTLTNRTELQRALNQMFQDKLGRNATDSELTKYLKQVNSQERSHPQVATSDAAGNTSVSGGVDPMQVAENYLNQIQGGEVGTRLAGVDYFAAAMRLIGGGDLG